MFIKWPYSTIGLATIDSVGFQKYLIATSNHFNVRCICRDRFEAVMLDVFDGIGVDYWVYKVVRLPSSIFGVCFRIIFFYSFFLAMSK